MKTAGLEPDPSVFSPEVMMALRERNVFNLEGELKLAGSISGPFFPTNGAELLVAAIGTDVVSGTTSPYTHTISAANVLPSLTIEKNLGNYESAQYAGCIVNKYGLKLAAGSTEAEITADIIAQSVAVLSSPTAVTVTNELPYTFAEATVTLLGQSVGAYVRDIEFTLDNMVKDTFTLNGAHTAKFITPTARHITGKLSIVFQSLDDATYGYFNKTINYTTGALVLALTHASPAYGVTVTLPKIQFSKYADDIKLNDIIISQIEFEAFYDFATSKSIGAVLTNGKSTGY